MENAQLIGLSRQTALRRNLDVVANNLANVNTTGFKGQSLHFEEFLMPLAEATAFPNSDRALSYTRDYATTQNLAQGAVQQTGNPLDLAIQGQGWLTVQGPNGQERYTREGSLVLGPDGILQTQSGFPVLVDGAPVQINPDDAPITITKDGTLSTRQGQLGRLQIVDFDNPQTLQREGENIFAGANPIPAQDAQVIQGALEGSNVQGVTEITRMIEITRQYQSVSKMMSERANLRQRAIRELGRVGA